MWKATQDQVDNPLYKAFSRATTNRLIWREQAAAPIQKNAEFYIPGVPQEPDATTTTILLNFDHELEDRSGKQNHAIFEFTNDQLLFTDGRDVDLSFAINFNPASNNTFDKLWIPFSNTTQILYDTPTGFSIFTRIMPTVLTAIGQTASPTPLTNRLKYFGGPVLNKVNVAIHNIFWSSEWNDSSTPFRSGAGGGDMNGPSVRTAMTDTIMPTIVNSQHYDGLWSYGWPNPPKKPVIGGNITHTGTALPGGFGSDVTLADGAQVVKDCISAATVPNPDSTAQTATDKDGGPLPSPFPLDYHHIYFIHIPPSRGLLGAGGVAWREISQAGNHWLYCMLTYYPNNAGGEGITTAMNAGQAWAHEIFHHLAEMAAIGGCGEQGYAAFYYNFGGECNWIQHSQNNLCGGNVVRLSGTNVYTEHYWSDIDGKCIAPGSGESWTAAPVQTGPIIRRYIFQKMDDLDNAATAAIGDNGVVYFNVKKAGIEYKVKTSAGAIRANEWFDLWFTFDSVTNSPRIYINNVLHDTASTEVLAWNNTHSHFILANRNLGASLGQFRGRMDDFRLYRSAVINTQQVDNLGNNGLTVTGLPIDSEHGIFIANRFKIDSQLENTGVFVTGDCEGADVPAAISSFTTASFTSASFTL